jgi:hypothetical protein
MLRKERSASIANKRNEHAYPGLKTVYRLLQVKWFPAGNIFNDIKIFPLTIFNIVWGNK